MTELLYYKDANLKNFVSRIISAEMTEYKEKNVIDIILDCSGFFPNEGGQDSDTGWIITDSICFEIFHVYIAEGVLHHLSEKYDHNDSAPVNESELQMLLMQLKGKTVQGSLNFEERYDKMQQHSGEHLASGYINRTFGFDNVGFHLGSDEVTMDFNGTFSEEDLWAIEYNVNQAIYANVETKCYFPTEDELALIPYRSKKELTGAVRIVEFPGFDICACCAPHVSRTGEIGIFKIISSEHFRGGTRMKICCGNRALLDYRDRFSQIQAVSQLLSSKSCDVSDTVKKLYDDFLAAKFKIIGLIRQILDFECEKAVKDGCFLIISDITDVNAAREAVKKMLDYTDGYCGILFGAEAESKNFIFAALNLNCNDLIKTLKTDYQIRGGGRPEMVQGSINTSENSDNLKKYFMELS